MGLTKPDDINQRMVDAFDPDYYASLHRLCKYAFGDSWEKQPWAQWGISDGFPYYPHLWPKIFENGISRRILNTAYYAKSVNLYSEPELEFPDIDMGRAAVRQAYFRSRALGTGQANGEWQEQHAQTFAEADGLGIGFTEIVLRTDQVSGLKYVDLKHIPALQVLRDPNQKDPSRYRYIVFVHYMSPDEFEAIYKIPAGKYTTQQIVSDNAWGAQTIDMVRVFEYFDVGYAGGDPTYAVIPRNWNNKPIRHQRSPFDFLPVAYMLNDQAPLMRYPYGRIMKQMPIQEEINVLERRLREMVEKGSPLDVFDPAQIDERDIEALKRGDSLPLLIYVNNMEGKVPIERIPGAPVDDNLLNLKQVLETEFNAASGTTELDRGSLSSKQRTLGENQILDQRSQTQGSWVTKALLDYYRRLGELVCKVGAEYDRVPIELNIKGKIVKFNDPSSVHSMLDKWLSPESRVLISEESIQKTDLDQKRAYRLQQLEAVIPTVMQLGTGDPEVITKQLVDAIGGNPEEWMRNSPYMQAKRQQAAQEQAQMGAGQAGQQGAAVQGNPQQIRANEKAAVFAPPYAGPVTTGLPANPG